MNVSSVDGKALYPKEPSRRSGEERNHDRPTKWQWSVDARVARNIARRSGHGQRRSRARRALFLALLGPLLLIPQRVGEDLGQKLRTAKGARERQVALGRIEAVNELAITEPPTFALVAVHYHVPVDFAAKVLEVALLQTHD